MSAKPSKLKRRLRKATLEKLSEWILKDEFESAEQKKLIINRFKKLNLLLRK